MKGKEHIKDRLRRDGMLNMKQTQKSNLHTFLGIMIRFCRQERGTVAQWKE